MYGYEPESRVPRFIKPLISLGIVALLIYWLFSFLFSLLGVGNALERQAATLRVDGRGSVTVSLQGESPQTAQNGMSMFPDDSVATTSSAHASLQFFDGTWMRSDTASALTIDESAIGETTSSLEMTLTSGRLWLHTPSVRSFTGSIVRMVHTPNFTATVPAGSDAVIENGILAVFAASGEGVRVSRSGEEDFFIGEGQKWTVPPGDAISDDPYATRTVLSAEDRDDPFVLESRVQAGEGTLPNGTSGSSSSSTSSTATSAASSNPSAGGTTAAPTITVPAATGQTYRTNEEEVILRGTSPASATAIYVNDYKLQLFTPSKGTWSYLASQSLGNMRQGQNVYNVTAEDAEGKRSDPASITIIVGEGEGGAQSSSVALDSSTLPQNAPLDSGSLAVTGPTAGAMHTETGTGFLLEGTTSAQTASVWVNDYRLQLFVPGKTYWNYIASVAFGNLKRGQNTYRVVARNENNEILDVLEYTVTFTPEL